MGILNTITFDDVVSSDYGIYISGEGAFNAPNRQVEVASIPGRNGDLHLDQGRYENIEVTYPAYNFEGNLADFRTKLGNFRSALESKIGYKRLVDTFHPEEFRLGVFRNGFEFDPVMYNYAGEVSLVFDCKPQRFLVSGETAQTFSASGSISNPTLFASNPMLEVVGTGTVTIGAYSFTISSNPGRIYIDADIMEAWSLSGSTKVSQNGAVVYTNHKTPKIEPGTVSITLGSGITELKVTPRWWRL